jgi:hypothetical protein
VTPGFRKRSRTAGVSHSRRWTRTGRLFDILNMPITVLGVLFVVVAVNVFLYFGNYSSNTPDALPAEHTAPSTTIERTELAGPKEVTRPQRTSPATTLQSTIPTDQSATSSP